MIRFGQPILAAALTLGAAGCGFTHSGGGSRTLEVVARADYDLSNDTVTMSVTVDDSAGVPVIDAQVVMRDVESDQVYSLPFVNGNLYEQAVFGYRRLLALEVNRGNDFLAVNLQGPSPHILTTPVTGTTATLGADLPVGWKVADGVRAHQVIISLDVSNFTTVLIDDPGAYAIPGTMMALGTQNLTVRRVHSIPLPGGLGTSSFAVSYGITQGISIAPL